MTASVVSGMAQSYNLFLYLASKSYNKGQKKQAHGLLVYPRCDALLGAVPVPVPEHTAHDLDFVLAVQHFHGFMCRVVAADLELAVQALAHALDE